MDNKSRNLGMSIDGEKIQLTEQGLKEREARLDELINVVRPKILNELVEARSQGDLSENADYDAAKNKQAEVEAEILELETLLTKVEIVKPNSQNLVKIGSTVKFFNVEKNIEQIVKVVGSIEANLKTEIPNISSNSPLGIALINNKVNQEVSVQTKSKTYKVKILEIK